MFPIGPWPISDEKFAFARALIEDLSSLGYEIRRDQEAIYFSQRLPNPTTDCRAFYREAHHKLHRIRLKQHAERVLAFEKEFGPHVFVDGATLDFAAIEPRIRPVNLRKDANTSRRDREVVQYLRTYQTISSHMSVGRENAFILEDYGRKEAPVMGVLVLASPRFYQPRRDEVFGWLSPKQLSSLSERKQKRHLKIRMAGLNRTMQVAICCALPPYSLLGVAQLLAVAPFTAIVQQDFANRWYDRRRNPDPDLAAVTTTTSMGTTGTPFQNLRAGRFIDAKSAKRRGANWNRDGEIYARLALTHPWRRDQPLTTNEIFADFRELVSDQTIEQALSLAKAGGAGDLERTYVLIQAMQQIGITEKIFHGNPVGVFLGALDLPSVEALETGHARANRPVLNWDMAVQQFRSDFGEGSRPTKAPGLKPAERAEAIAKRRERASRIRLDDILLSRRLRSSNS
jgi:hypothetical protein